MNRSTATNSIRLLLPVALLWGMLPVAQGQQGLYCPVPKTGNPGGASCAVDAGSQSGSSSTGAGNPIDLTSGNKYQREVDVDLSGPLGLMFVRHYNSLSAREGVLGRGWSHTYETRLTRTEARTGKKPEVQITVTQGDGRVIRFSPLPAGADGAKRYRSEPSGFGLIVEDPAALERTRRSLAEHGALPLTGELIWRWHWPDGRVVSFDARGLLERIETPEGRALTLEFDTHRRLSRVTDSYGNWLAASYWDDPSARLQSFDAPKSPGVARGTGFRGRLKSLTLSSGQHIQYEYDPRGELQDVRYADGSLRRYEYGRALGRPLLSKIYGRDGRLFASFEYDAHGYATRSTHPDHRDDVEVSYRWSKAAQDPAVTTVTNNAGEQTSYLWRTDVVSGSPVIVEAHGAGCRSCPASNVRYQREADGRRLEQVLLDPAGHPFEQRSSTFDELGRLTSLEIADFDHGHLQAPSWRETREYPGDSFLPTLIAESSVVPGRLHTLRIRYNERGQSVEITEEGFSPQAPRGMLRVSADAGLASPLRRVTAITYEHIGGLSLPASVDGPLPGSQDTWHFHYDAVGRLLSIEHPTRIIEQFERDSWGRIVAHKGLDGVRETLEYNTDGRISRLARGQSWMRLEYDPTGAVRDVFDSLGERLNLVHNAAGELVEVGDSAGNRIRWRYDEHGVPREEQLLTPDGQIDQRRFLGEALEGGDARNQDGGLPGTVPNEGLLSAVPGALPDEVADALRTAGTSAEGAPGAASAGSSEGQGGSRLRVAYDAQGRPTTYVYDDFGRLVAERSPVTGTSFFKWDEADHLIERIGADGSVTHITRDALGRAIRVRAGTEDGRIEWGAANRPTRITYQAGEERFEYDREAHLTAHTQRVDGRVFRVAYELDPLGRVVRKRLADGTVLAYRYNSLLHPKPGVLAGIDKEGLVNRPIITDVNTPDERFSNIGFTFGNGLSQRRVLDVDGHMLGAGNPKVGESELRMPGQPAASATGFQRVGQQGAGSSGESGSLQVRYSRQATVGAQVAADSAPALQERLLADWLDRSEGAVPVSTTPATSPYAAHGEEIFDVRGQLLQDGERRYEWDALGRLARVFEREGSGFVRTSTVPTAGNAERLISEYRYNLLGQRIAKVTHDRQGVHITYFLWDGDELGAEIGQTGQVLRQYVYLEGRPVAMLSGSSIYAIHTDHRLAPIAVTDSARRVVWQADVHDNGAADVLPASTIELPLRASNQYFDAETGLHYNLNRYLDAVRGRYLSPDPLGLATGPDLYQFALGRPHQFIDVLGLQTSTDWSQKSLADRLTAIVKQAVPLVPGVIGSALQQLIQPAALAQMTAIFAVFTAAQATPIGWIADAALLGWSAWSLGSGLTEMLQMLSQLYKDAQNAKCDADIKAAAQRLANSFVSSGGQIAAGLAGVFGSVQSGGTTRIASGLNDLIDFAKTRLGSTAATDELVLAQGGAVASTQALKSGLGGTATQAQTGVTWATVVNGIKAQGKAFEDWVQTQLPKGTVQTPWSYKTIDHFNFDTGVATSTKTLNTAGSSYQSSTAVYNTLKGYIDALNGFKGGPRYGNFEPITPSEIQGKQLELGVPDTTNAAQWTQINQAIQYAKGLGIDLVVTVITP